MKSLMSRPPKELIWLTSAALTALIVSVAWFGIRHGVRHDSNIGALFGLVAMCLGGVTVISGLATLIWVFLAFRASSLVWRWSGLAVSLLAILSPWQSHEALRYFGAITERADFEKAGADQLRLAAKELVLSAAHKDYELRWFGGEVPDHEVPSAIRNFIPGAAYVTVDMHCVVMVTDGLGGWRGGYMITPTGSDFIPKNSRRIANGFYYVVTSGGN